VELAGDLPRYLWRRIAGLYDGRLHPKAGQLDLFAAFGALIDTNSWPRFYEGFPVMHGALPLVDQCSRMVYEEILSSFEHIPMVPLSADLVNPAVLIAT